MSVIQSHILFVLRRFPESKNLILQLFKKNPDFGSLCHDYGECAAALKLWNQSTAEDAQNRIREYSELLIELEKEILEYVCEQK